MEGRTERIAQPLGGLDLFARALDRSVVQADDNILWTVLGDCSADDRPKQGARIPSTPAEEFVVGTPVLMLAIVKANGTGYGAAPQPAQATSRSQGPGAGCAARLCVRRCRKSAHSART